MLLIKNFGLPVKELDLMGYLHFYVYDEETHYNFRVHNKSNVSYEEQKNNNYYGPLIGNFKISKDRLENLKDIHAIDCGGTVFIAKFDDSNRRQFKTPLKYNKQANKYDFDYKKGLPLKQATKLQIMKNKNERS